MGEKLVSSSTLRGMLRAKMAGRTVRAVAAELGVSAGFLVDVLAGKKALGAKIPAHFELRPIVLYEWTDQARRDKA